MACNEAVALLSENNSQLLIEKPDGKCFDTLVRENAVSKSLLGQKSTSRTGAKEASEPTVALHTVSNNKNAPQAKAEENGGHKTSLVKHKSFSKLSHNSRASLKMREMAKMDDGHGNDTIEKNISTSRVNLGKDDHEDVGVSVGQFNKGLVEEMASKKENRGGFGNVSSAKMNNNGKTRKLITFDDEEDDVKTLAPSSSKDKYKFQREIDSCEVEELPSKRLKIDNTTKLTRDKLCRDSSMVSSNVEHERDFRPMEVTQRPDDVSCIASPFSLSS